MDATLMQALAAGLGQNDPALASRLEMLQKLLHQAQPQPAPGADFEQRRARARERIRRTLQRNSQLERRCALLARALGACDCWGEHAHCQDCRGRGRAGYYAIDRELFALLVQPAIPAAVAAPVASSDVEGTSSNSTTTPQKEKA